MRFGRLVSAAALVSAIVVAGCGGGGGSGASGQSRPVPLAPPSVSVNKVQITALNTPATVTVTEAGYTGSFTVNSATCAGIASIVPAAQPSAFTVTGIGPGTCLATFTDTFTQSIAISISVTASVVVAT